MSRQINNTVTGHPAAARVKTPHVRRSHHSSQYAAHTTLSDARQALNAAKSAQTTAENNETAALKTLRKRVRGLIDELGTLIADDDVRYEAFGLNIPANPSAPEGIEDLTATAMGGKKVYLVWTYATRMTGSRIMRKVVGVDEEPVSIGTVAGLDKLLLDQPEGATVEYFIVPYNDGGDGAESPVRSVVVL